MITKLKTLVIFSFLMAVLVVRPQAQSIENSINLYGINFPQEKMHIHFDKEIYLPGETIWFKAYLFEEDLPSERSTNFYAALYDEDGKLIQQQISPIFNSTSDGHFDIPDSLKDRQLICRAYTTWMLNFDTSFLFTKAIKLINNNAPQGPAGKVENDNSAKTVGLQFFPEGGDIIEGTRNTIAFKANYNNGLPFEINGVIKKQETGEVIIPLKTLHDGMGRFDLEIQPNERFYAEWIDNKGTAQQTYLPKAKPVGVSLKLVQQKNNLVFNIVNKLPNDSLHVLMYMYQKVFYKINLSVSAAEPYTGLVPVHTLPTGTMQLTVFDANWQAVAERVAFINNDNYTAGITISNKETSTQKRGKNSIEIEVADTISANMSLSITDAEINNQVAGSTIVTNLLLSGDVKGYIHEPAYYFTNNADANLKASLDLVMLTHGWRKYNWNMMFAGTMPGINYPADNYLSAYGQVSREVMDKMTKDENVNLIIKTKDSTNNFYSLLPDSTGLLKQTGLIFYDTARVLYSFNKNKTWNTKMAFSTFNYTYSQPLTINNFLDHFVPDTTGYVKYNTTASLFNYYNNNKANQPFNKEKTLQGVVVNSGGWHNWKNDPLYKMEERYASGIFRSGVGFGFDVMHDEMSMARTDVYSYMIGKVPGLLVNSFGGVKSFKATDGKAVILFIDEHEAYDGEIDMLNVENIAYIKFVDYYGARPGLPHALSIYTKKGDDLIDRRPKVTDMRLVQISGYSPVKEFYSPDYAESNTTMGTDARTTLLWAPYVLTNAANRKVPVTFYNNDLTKKIKVVLEGINDKGKLIHIEKIIE